MRTKSMLLSTAIITAIAVVGVSVEEHHNQVDPVSIAPFVTTPTTDKVLLIVLENHADAQMKKDAPFTYGLGTTYGRGTNMVASCGHPSQPNYACMTYGETKGITTDSESKKVNAPTVFGNTIKAGRTAKGMMEGMGSTRCRQTNTGKYVKKHDGWATSSNKTDHTLCVKYVFSYDTYGAADIKNGKLANVEVLIPNQCNNAHDCPLSTFDAWMRKTWARIVDGPDWKSGRLTVVITADEDDRKHGNVIPLIVANPNLHGKVVTTRLTGYSINRMLSSFGHSPFMANGKTAPDLPAAFELNVG
jgi:phosphatidylinositol-3-phosphatase